MKNLYNNAVKRSKMNALKSGYFAAISPDDCEEDPFFQDVFQQLMHSIDHTNPEKVSIAKKIAFYHLKQQQLDDAMAQYKEKWIYKQRTAKDLAHRATNGMAPILEKPDLSMLFEIAQKDHYARAELRHSCNTEYELKKHLVKIRGNFVIMVRDFIEGIKNHKDVYDREDIKLCQKASRQAIDFASVDINFYHNQRVYAEYTDEIMAFLEKLPTIPDTGHWRNMVSEGNKIREKLDSLHHTLQKLDESEGINPLSDTESDNEDKMVLEKQIEENLTQTHQEMDHFQDENKEMPDQKEMLLE